MKDGGGEDRTRVGRKAGSEYSKRIGMRGTQRENIKSVRRERDWEGGIDERNGRRSYRQQEFIYSFSISYQSTTIICDKKNLTISKKKNKQTRKKKKQQKRGSFIVSGHSLYSTKQQSVAKKNLT